MFETFKAERVVALERLSRDLHRVTEEHAQADAKRHLENLNRFASIEVRLARMGNGGEGHRHKA
jgi:hypothetical protein